MFKQIFTCLIISIVMVGCAAKHQQSEFPMIVSGVADWNWKGSTDWAYDIGDLEILKKIHLEIDKGDHEVEIVVILNNHIVHQDFSNARVVLMFVKQTSMLFQQQRVGGLSKNG